MNSKHKKISYLLIRQALLFLLIIFSFAQCFDPEYVGPPYNTTPYPTKPLHIAANSGTIKQAKTLLTKSNNNIDEKDERDNTPLSLAIANNQPAMVEYLLQQGANSNLKIRCQSPLTYACSIWGVNESVIDILLQKTDLTKVVDPTTGSTVLHEVCYVQPEAIIFKKLLEKGIQLNVPDVQGNTPLHILLDNGEKYYSKDKAKDLLKLLLAQEALNINQPNYCGLTPLHIAFTKNFDAATIYLLLEKGARLDSQDQDKRTPLHLAVNAKIDWDALNLAQIIAERNTNINIQDQAGNTPLHLAIQQADINLTKALMQNRAQTAILNQQGLTALDLVRVKLPQAKNVDPKVKTELQNLLYAKDNKIGFTPLHLACFMGASNIKAVLELIEKGADINAQDDQGRTPLHILVSGGIHKNTNYRAIEILKLLLAQKSLNINKTNNFWITPLHEAFIDGSNWEVISLLLRGGARLDIPDQLGRTPLYLAEHSENRQTFDRGKINYYNNLKQWSLQNQMVTD